jgi:hypothetical protein
VSGYHGGASDAWVFKIDSLGTLVWQKCLGGSNSDWASSVIQTNDRGFILTGLTYSNDGDITSNHGSNDVWVIKVDSVGNIQWQKCFGGTGNDVGTSIIQNEDSTYIFAAITNSADGDVTHSYAAGDGWVVKINPTGSILWEKTFGGTGADGFIKIVKSSNNLYTLGGVNSSTDGNITDHHGSSMFDDYWILQIDSIGNLINSQSFGGSDEDQFYGLRLTNDSNIILTGYSYSSDGDVTNHIGDIDVWVVKLSEQLSNSNKDVSEQLFDIHPMVENGIINCSLFSSKPQLITFKIFDLQGKIIYERSLQAFYGLNNLQLFNLNSTSGMYFINISTETFETTVKVGY